jgi:hypothetical protein
VSALPAVPKTREEAIALCKSGWWKGRPALEVALWQLEVDLLSMDFSDFHKAVEEACGRPVWTHEFAFGGRERLRAEMLKERAAPSMVEILDLLPAEKTIVVVVDDKRTEMPS